MQATEEYVLKSNRITTIGFPLYVTIVNMWTDLKPLKHMLLASASDGKKSIVMTESHFKIYYEEA
jgi:hypothetical protein